MMPGCRPGSVYVCPLIGSMNVWVPVYVFMYAYPEMAHTYAVILLFFSTLS